jgi:hypothetical protein
VDALVGSGTLLNDTLYERVATAISTLAKVASLISEAGLEETSSGYRNLAMGAANSPSNWFTDAKPSQD